MNYDSFTEYKLDIFKIHFPENYLEKILKSYIKNKGKRNRLQRALMFAIGKHVFFPTQNNYS